MLLVLFITLCVLQLNVGTLSARTKVDEGLEVCFFPNTDTEKYRTYYDC